MPKEVTSEELDQMIAKGFEQTALKVDTASKSDIKRIDDRIDQVDKRLDNLDARMGRMEADLTEIRGNIVYKHEFEDLMARVKYIETKMGIESGK